METKHDCLVCSVPQTCGDDSILLFAETPILREIVITHLRDMQVSFQLEGELFRVNAGHTAAIAGLRRRLSAPERGDLRVSRERGARLLAACSLEEYGRHLDTDWFETSLRNDAFTVHFQPIIDTARQSVFAHECLIRLVSGRTYSGGEIVEAAIARGSVHVFDSYARQLSVRKAAEQFIPATKVFINFMPSSIYDPAFCMKSTLGAMARTVLRPEDIVFEVVESERVQDVRHLQRICEYYRKEGFGFALDDVGTGSNSLQMVCDLKPDYIKLDKSLISRVSEPMYRTAVEKLAEFAGLYGLQVIAEGVETAGTVAMLRQIGIGLMQGYHFARPSAKMIFRRDGVSDDLIQLALQTDLGGSPRFETPTPVQS
jgi:EAL domain-containing protein (putative c-di-GMP-specific phosphodiesterase class I)